MFIGRLYIELAVSDNLYVITGKCYERMGYEDILSTEDHEIYETRIEYLWVLLKMLIKHIYGLYIYQH